MEKGERDRSETVFARTDYWGLREAHARLIGASPVANAADTGCGGSDLGQSEPQRGDRNALAGKRLITRCGVGSRVDGRSWRRVVIGGLRLSKAQPPLGYFSDGVENVVRGASIR